MGGNGYTNGKEYTCTNTCTKDNRYISGGKYSLWNVHHNTNGYILTQRVLRGYLIHTGCGFEYTGIRAAST